MYKVLVHCESEHAKSPFILELYFSNEELSQTVEQLLFGRYVRVKEGYFDNFTITDVEYFKEQE